MTRLAIRRWLHENGLSIVLATLFLLMLAGQTAAGWFHYNDENARHHEPVVSLTAYLKTGAFGEAVFENWESEFLQMALYVVLTVFLFQKGSAESKDPGSGEKTHSAQTRASPWPVRRGGIVLAIYNHSLSLAFFLLFAASFAGHAVCGLAARNEEAAAHGLPATSLSGYLTSSRFWFESLQNWQSEFLAIFAIVALSIWFREKGSPESKSVSAPHSKTGG